MASGATEMSDARWDLDFRPKATPSSASIRSWYVVSQRRAWRPPTDVYETDRTIVVKVEVAGMREDDFDISFRDRRLVIAGHRRDTGGKLGYHNMEIRYGEFRTEVRVGWAVDESSITASYEDGFLYISLSKNVERHQVAVRVLDPDE